MLVKDRWRNVVLVTDKWDKSQRQSTPRQWSVVWTSLISNAGVNILVNTGLWNDFLFTKPVLEYSIILLECGPPTQVVIAFVIPALLSILKFIWTSCSSFLVVYLKVIHYFVYILYPVTKRIFPTPVPYRSITHISRKLTSLCSPFHCFDSAELKLQLIFCNYGTDSTHHENQSVGIKLVPNYLFLVD